MQEIHSIPAPTRDALTLSSKPHNYVNVSASAQVEMIFAGSALARLQLKGNMCLCGELTGEPERPASHVRPQLCPVARFFASVDAMQKWTEEKSFAPTDPSLEKELGSLHVASNGNTTMVRHAAWDRDLMPVPIDRRRAVPPPPQEEPFRDLSPNTTYERLRNLVVALGVIGCFALAWACYRLVLLQGGF